MTGSSNVNTGYTVYSLRSLGSINWGTLTNKEFAGVWSCNDYKL